MAKIEEGKWKKRSRRFWRREDEEEWRILEMGRRIWKKMAIRDKR